MLGNRCTSAVCLFSCEQTTAVPHMGSRWDESNPSPTLTKPTSTLQQVLANSAGIAVAWEAELPHRPTQLHGQAVVKQVHQVLQTRRRICHKAPHITNQFVPHSRWFHCQLPRKGAQAQTNPQRSSRSTACALPAWLSTAEREWSTKLVWLAPRHNHAPHTQNHSTHNNTTNWHCVGTLRYKQPNQ